MSKKIEMRLKWDCICGQPLTEEADKPENTLECPVCGIVWRVRNLDGTKFEVVMLDEEADLAWAEDLRTTFCLPTTENLVGFITNRYDELIPALKKLYKKLKVPK